MAICFIDTNDGNLFRTILEKKRNPCELSFLSVYLVGVGYKSNLQTFLSWKALLLSKYLPSILVHLTCTSSVLPHVSPLHTSDVVGNNTDPPGENLYKIIFRIYTCNGKYVSIYTYFCNKNYQ